MGSYHGVDGESLRVRIGCAALYLFDEVSSTMDVAHDLAAAGALHGTVVASLRQSAGRGREGRTWVSGDSGVWFTVIGRNPDPEAGLVLSIRIGLTLGAALRALTEESVALKWPNDIFTPSGKVAGVLVETRWRGTLPEWSAAGVGVNLTPPAEVAGCAGLPHDVTHPGVLVTAAAAALAAVNSTGSLRRTEVAEYMNCDFLRGKKITQPLDGTVLGISEDGELVVSTANGITSARSGSVVLAEIP